MNLVNISKAMAAQWNAFVAGWPHFELMQSYEWGTFKEAFGWKAVRLALEHNGQWVAGVQMLIKSMPLGLTGFIYVPRGPLVNWQDKPAVQALLKAMHDVARHHRAISLKIEPAVRQTHDLLQSLQSCGFGPSQYNNQPQCSMLIDLRPDLDTILANMHKSTRYNIRYSERKGVTIREGDESDLPTFYRLLQYTARRAGFPARSLGYYQEQWNSLSREGRVKLFLAIYKDEVVAMRMPAAFGGKAATFHSGSFDSHRNLKPNELLMWECIRWAKAQGCIVYDVWGIPDKIGEILRCGETIPENEKGGLWGVYYFKRGFGGDPVFYIGAYDFVYSRPLYRLMNGAMARLGSLDKFAQLADRLNLKPEFSTSV